MTIDTQTAALRLEIFKFVTKNYACGNLHGGVDSAKYVWSAIEGLVTQNATYDASMNMIKTNEDK